MFIQYPEATTAAATATAAAATTTTARSVCQQKETYHKGE